MKKVTTILLLLIFLITNSGIAVSAHWCGGKLASIDFFSKEGHECKCGKKAMKPNCCKDATFLLQANDELAKTSHFVFNLDTPKLVLGFYNQLLTLPDAHLQSAVFSLYHPPPIKSNAPIYIWDRVFLI